MKRQLITALMVAATSAASMGSLQADCGGLGCHTGYGFNNGFNDFHARYGCSPRQAFILFQRNPQLITRFPEMARLLQSQFGEFTTTPAAAVTTTGVVAGTAAAVGTPVGGAVAATPADGAAVAAPVDGAAAATPAAPAVATPAAATPAPVDAAPAAVTPAAAVDAAADAAPAVVDPVTVPTAVEADVPAAAVISPELEPLLGLWVNESDDPDQPISKITLERSGNALVTVNTELGQSEVKKPFAVEDGVFKLGGDELAKVVSANADKVVLDSNGTNLTFVRP